MLGAGLVMYPLIQATWSASAWELLVAGALVVGWLARQQRANSRRRRDSLIAVTLFGNRGFVAALVCLALFFAVLNGLMLVIVLRSQLGLHASVLTASLTLLPWSIGMGVSAVLAGSYRELIELDLDVHIPPPIVGTCDTEHRSQTWTSDPRRQAQERRSRLPTSLSTPDQAQANPLE